MRPQFPHTNTVPAYVQLITKCWAQNPNDRSTFDQIVQELKELEFIYQAIEIEEFEDYIDDIDNYSSTFDTARRVTPIEIFQLIINHQLNNVSDKDQINGVDKFGLLNEKGEPISTSKKEADRFIRLAAKEDYLTAIRTDYIKVDDIDKASDQTKAGQYFQTAADNDHPK